MGQILKNIKVKWFKKIPETDISTTLPGSMKAFESLHKNYSFLDLEELCQPAIHYAKTSVVHQELL